MRVKEGVAKVKAGAAKVKAGGGEGYASASHLMIYKHAVLDDMQSFAPVIYNSCGIDYIHAFSVMKGSEGGD